jgi:2,4-dienoyl-CoA reductase-like NADH-dependent reductase (Old Yellow Enzyme family)
MWTPPEKIVHPLPDAAWPDAETAAQARWFQPVQCGPVTLEQRTWIPAMVPWRSNNDGEVTPEVIGWYERFAKGRPGALVVEATGVRDIPSGPLLRIGHDRYIPGLRRLTDAVREASGGHTRLFIQIIDFLAIKRRPPADKFFRRFLTITDAHRAALDLAGADEAAVRERLLELEQSDPARIDAILKPHELEALRYGYRERVTDTHLPHIAELPQVLPPIFAAAAARAEAAGFDGVELHYAHAYTMASFLSALNTRTDGYGGALEHRLRLPLEVHRACRDAVSDRFAVGCRFLSTDVVPGGNTVADAAQIGAAFAQAGMDFLSLSRGGRFEDAQQPKVGAAAYPYTGPSGYECMPSVKSDARGPFGRNVEAAAQVRAAIRAAGCDTPTVVAGGIGTFAQAEAILAAGQADIVAAARQSIADPDWFRKVRLGRGGEIRRCKYTNYCEALDQKHEIVTCQLWDRIDPAAAGQRSPDGKRRLLAPSWSEGDAPAEPLTSAEWMRAQRAKRS